MITNDLVYRESTQSIHNCEIPGNYEYVNHPAHYNREDSMECIDEMIALYGVEPTMWFCALSAHKYRYRAGEKPGNDGKRDLAKSDWYMKKFVELRKELGHKLKKIRYLRESWMS